MQSDKKFDPVEQLEILLEDLATQISKCDEYEKKTSYNHLIGHFLNAMAIKNKIKQNKEEIKTPEINFIEGISDIEDI